VPVGSLLRLTQRDCSAESEDCHATPATVAYSRRDPGTACDVATEANDPASPETPRAGAPGLAVTRVPIEETLTLFEPNCAGELLEVHFRQQLVVHETTDANGSSHFHSVINDQGTTAIGLTSGVTYHQTGATTQTENIIEVAPLTMTIYNALNLVSDGSGPNLQVQQLFHVTVNAIDVVTSLIDATVITCK
jgi:hypothetical protein